MATSEVQHDVGPLVLVGTGLVLTLFHGAHALEADESLLGLATGVLVPIALSLLVTYGSYWLHRSSLGPERSFRVAVWGVIGGGILGVGVSSAIVYQATHGVIIADPIASGLGAVSLGMPAGTLVDVYDAQQRREGDRARQANNKLTVLNRVLRHNLRNRMNVIQGRAELLAETAVRDPAASADHVRAIDRAVDDLNAISRQAEDVEMLVGSTYATRQVLDLTVAVERAAASVREAYPEAQVDEPDVDTCLVRAHPRLELAVEELLENAVEHGDTQNPGVELRDGPGADGVELHVVDDGSGIPEPVVETLDRGYEMSLDHNTGLGLWLVSWLVDASGGTVRFRTAEGTVASLSLDRAQSAGTPVAELVSSPLEDGPTAPSTADD
ncbi:MAG: ATP-binding protein [Halolamina sp.]